MNPFYFTGNFLDSKYKYKRRASLQDSLLTTKKPSSGRKTNSIEGFRNMNSKSESTSAKRKLTLEHRRKYPVSNGEILKFLSREEIALYLEKIFNEEIPSERHDIVCKMFKIGKLDFGIHSKIFHLAQVQFLEDDRAIDSKLCEVMNRIFQRVDVSRVPGMVKRDNDSFDSQANHYRHKYIFHVLVPEGIVKYLQDKNGWDKNTAENFYLDGESRVTNSELKEFDEELDEDAKREKERKLRERYETSDEDSEDIGTDEDNEEMLELPNLDYPEKIEYGGTKVGTKLASTAQKYTLHEKPYIKRDQRNKLKLGEG